MANYNYIKENSLAFFKMVYEIIDGTDKNKWRDDEHKNEFKYGIVADYFNGLRNLLELDISENNPLNTHKLYADSFAKLCERYKIEGNQCFTGKEDKHLEVLCLKIDDWVNNGMIELREAEKKHYTKSAFDYKDNPSLPQPNRLHDLKAQIKWNSSKQAFTNNLG
jgi:hypothetical protein